MTKMNECALVRDLMPLYIDHVVSEETEDFMMEHLEKCPECKVLFDEMSRELVLPINAEEQMGERKIFEKFKKAINKKVWKWVLILTASFSIFITSFVILNLVEREIDPSEITFSESNGRVMITYPEDFRFEAWGKLNTENENPTTLTIQFKQSLWDQYISPIYDPGDHSQYFGNTQCEVYDIHGNLLWRGSGMDSMD